jgi:polyhydroxyalkanoate synthesis repressor PhaR
MVQRGEQRPMAKSDPVTIKKYANRRLYNTGTSTYVTLEDLAQMVKKGDDFVVFDAKSGEEITRSVLAQIIFEQEGKDGQNLLPVAFLRQVIRFYGDSMQMMVPHFLELSMNSLANQKGQMRDKMTQAFGGASFGPFDEHVRMNMEIFEKAFGAFAVPFLAKDKPKGDAVASAPASSGDIDELKRQLADMQQKIEKLGR